MNYEAENNVVLPTIVHNAAEAFHPDFVQVTVPSPEKVQPIIHDCVAVSPNVVPDEAVNSPLTTVRFPQSEKS